MFMKDGYRSVVVDTVMMVDTSSLICVKVGFWMCKRSDAILLSAVLSRTTTQSAHCVNRFNVNAVRLNNNIRHSNTSHPSPERVLIWEKHCRSVQCFFDICPPTSQAHSCPYLIQFLLLRYCELGQPSKVGAVSLACLLYQTPPRVAILPEQIPSQLLPAPPPSLARYTFSGLYSFLYSLFMIVLMTSALIQEYTAGI